MSSPVYAAGGDDRDRAPGLVFKRLHRFHDLRDKQFEGVVGINDVFGAEAEMPAGLGAFHDEGVGHVAGAGHPLAGDEGGGAAGRDDGHELGLELFLFAFARFIENLGQVHRQPGAGEDHVGLGFDGGADHFGEGGQGDHDVHADDALRGFAGLFDFAAEGAEVCFNGVAGHIRFFHPNHGSGDDADAAFVGHGGSEPGKRNTNAHAALDDRSFSDEVAYVQSGKRHEEPPRGLLWSYGYASGNRNASLLLIPESIVGKI